MKKETVTTEAKAVVWRTAGHPRLESVQLPEPGAADVVVRIAYSGVSIGTEHSVISGARTHNGTFPLVSGYMAAGLIEQVGADVVNLKPGDRVVSWGTRFEAGLNSVWGAHCSRHVCAAASVTPVPAETDLRDASMWVLPRVGLNAVTLAGISETDTVVICGQGLIGQFFGQWAVARGARVIVVEPDSRRAALARRYVTPDVLNPLEDDVAKAVERLTRSQWPTVVVEATASKTLIGQATGLIRRMHARLVFLSWYPGDIAIPFGELHNHEVTAFFPTGAGSDETGRAVLEGLARGTIHMGENLTDCVPWTDSEAAFRRVCEGDRSIMGMVIDWSGAS